MRIPPIAAALAVLPALALAQAAPGPFAAPAASPEEARAFVEGANEALKRLLVRRETAEWIKSTHITDDTERNGARDRVEGFLESVIGVATILHARRALRADG
jgi:peptidyl-dipeptidase A